MLIRNADLALAADAGPLLRDVRVSGKRIEQIEASLKPIDDEPVLDAEGCALIPGLHDHHLHIVALAAAMQSLPCGPPHLNGSESLESALRAVGTEAGWLRGVGYHESVAGDIDRDWLDRHLPERPARLQHRSGRLWILNSAALSALGVRDDGAGNDPFERVDGRLTGRLYDADDWFRHRLGSKRPDLGQASLRLASRGITAMTDASHDNGPEDFDFFVGACERGELRQSVLLMGSASLESSMSSAQVRVGATKFHLHDHALPDFDSLCNDIRISHARGRNAAFHCVSRVDLAYALAALEAAGSAPGDRIEHASVTPPEALEAIQALGLTVVTQPLFVRERGDTYLIDVEPTDQPWLYRLRGFLDAGIPLAAGSDAPYGDADPWRSMAAAVDRRTGSGRPLGTAEALLPEQALGLFTSPLAHPGGDLVTLGPGVRADCCLLDRSWARAREDLAAVQVRLTLVDGRVIWQA